MAETATAPTKPTTVAKPTGKTFNFNLVGDDLFLYETVRDLFQDEEENDDATVNAALDDLDPQIRALVQSRLAPKPARKELSQRQVFVRALGETLAAREAAEDGSGDESDVPEGDDNDAATED